MQRKFIYPFVSIIILFTLGCSTTSTKGPTLNFTYPQPAIKNWTLNNGMRLLVKEEHRSPVVAITILVTCGSASEGKMLGSGVTHLLEHLIFKGTAKYPPGEIERTIKSYGGDINGWTTYDWTGYRIVIPKEGIDAVLDIGKEMLSNPSFEEKEIEKEKEVVLREAALREDNPSIRVSNLLRQTAYIRHPYRFPVIGYKEMLKALSREGLIEYFDLHYGPQNIIISIVGDIEADAIYQKIKELFEDIQRRPQAPVPREEEPVQMGIRFVEEEADIEGAYINIGFKSTSVLESDLFAMDLLAIILGGTEASRLNRRLVRDEESAYSVFCYNHTSRDNGLFIVGAVLNEDSIDRVMDSILNEIDRTKNKGVSEEEIVRAKNSLISDFIFSKEQFENQADDMAINTLLTGVPDFSRVYIEGIKKVSAKDILIAANKYLNTDNMSMAILRKRRQEPKLEGKRVSEIKEIENFKLENGLDVLILKDHSLPCIWVYTLFKGGVRIEDEETNGISNLLSLMLLGGTKKRTAEKIFQDIESKGGAINAFSENNSFGVWLRILKEEKGFAFELLSDILQNSQIPEEEINTEKIKLIGAIDMQDNSLFNQAIRQLKEVIFLTHPYRFQTIGRRESIENLSQKALKEFYRRFVSPKNCVLAIAGDFEKEEIKSLVRKYFEGWQDRGYKEPLVQEEAFQEEVRALKKAHSKKEAIILLGFPGISVYNNDRYILDVLLAIISGGGSRLYQSLREETGLAYTVGGNSVLGIDPGYIVLYALVSPEDTERAREMLINEIELVTKESPSEAELERAKRYLKGMFWIDNQASSSLLFTAGLEQLYGIGFENYKRYPDEIDRVRVEDVREVAERYLNLSKYSLVILSPKE